MALTQVVDVTRRLVINVAGGTVSIDELLENQQALRDDPTFEGSFRSLFDLRRIVEIDLSGEHLRTLAEGSPFNPGIQRAYVVTSRAQLGATRLYQAILNADRSTYRIFESYDEAVAWLDSGGA
jgi:hypothetical protein